MNTTGNNLTNGGPEGEAPDRVVQALAGLNRERVFIPPYVDARILNRVRPHLAVIRQQQPHRSNYLKWVALAACIAILLWLPSALRSNRNTFAREDVNHDGRVDILDAFQLAREMNAGKSLPKADDFNGDGRVDRADVELVARDAVKLNPERRL